MRIEMITAGAGTGKTHEMVKRVIEFLNRNEGNSVDQLVVTTFTNKAAQELRERISAELISQGKLEEAQKAGNAWIGTVHSLGQRLIDFFTYSSGFAPNQQVIPEEDEYWLFSQAVSEALDDDQYRKFNQLADSLQIIDWQRHIHDIVKKARENVIDLRIKNDFAGRSSELYKKQIYHPLEDKYQDKKKIIEKIKKIYRDLSQTAGRSKNRDEIVSLIPGLLRQFNEDNLSEISATIERLHELFNKLDSRNPELEVAFETAKGDWQQVPGWKTLNDLGDDHLDKYREYTNLVFEASSRVYEAYQSFKKKRSLVDFGDLENEFLHLITEKDEVKGFIQDKFKLLLVDEFQDTNPMQLAIFTGLAEIIPEVVFVGDRKQSIYRFRGVDFKLIDNVFNDTSVKKEITLDTSRRSRKDIVGFCNHLFTGVFSGQLNAEEIRLKHWEKIREDKNFLPAVQVWRTDGSRNQNQHKEKIIQKLVSIYRSDGSRENAFYHKNKTNGKIEKLRYGDTAILCWGNNDVESWAKLIEKAGLPVSAEREDLERQAEIVFLIAAMKYLAGKGNALAVAELLTLGDADYANKVGSLIDDRLDYLAKGGNISEWMKDHDIIIKLERNKPFLSVFSVKELIKRLIIDLDVYDHCSQWGNSLARKANVQRLLLLADKYEQDCQNYNLAETLQGFLDWFGSRKDLRQSPAFSGDAIHVMTYHKAKGLEWPLVIMDGLHKLIRADWYGIFCDNEQFDLKQPLKNRNLIFLHTPFGYDYYSNGNRYKTPVQAVMDIIHASSHYQKEWKAEIEERKRLLYVGMTRARSYLILPTPKYDKSKNKEKSWFRNTASSHLNGFFDKEKSFTLEHSDVSVEVLVLSTQESINEQRLPEFYYEKLPGPAEISYPEKNVSPSKLVAGKESIDAVNVNTKTEIHPDRLFDGSLDENDLGDALHNIMASWQQGESPEKRLKKIRFILRGYGIEENVDAEKLDRRIAEFHDWIHKQWPGSNIFTEYPLRMPENGRIYSGFADMVVDAGNGLILIDHKTFQGTKAQAVERAKKYAAQLQTYAGMLESSTGKSVVKKLVYYPVSGLVVQLDSPSKGGQNDHNKQS